MSSDMDQFLIQTRKPSLRKGERAIEVRILFARYWRLIQLQNRLFSNSRSSKVIDLGANRKRICNFLLVICSNFGRISYRLGGWGIKVENGLFSPTHPCLIRRNPLEFLDETYPAKTIEGRVATVWWKSHDPNFNRFWLIHPCDRRTDRRTCERSALSKYSVAR